MKAVIGSNSGPQVSFVGPFGVGKTTAVVTACDQDIVMTEVKRSNAQKPLGRHVKLTTTVGLEIGEWTAPSGEIVCVVGTPGQERFDVVRKSAMPRSSAVVLWLYGDHELAVQDTDLWLEFISSEVATRKLVVAITRLADDNDVENFRDVVTKHDPTIPLVSADPRDRDSVAKVLQTALDRASVRQVG